VQRCEHLLEAHLEGAQPPHEDSAGAAEYTDIQIRTTTRHVLSFEPPHTIVASRAEKVDGKQLELSTRTVKSFESVHGSSIPGDEPPHERWVV
jgi:hypothetical protein